MKHILMDNALEAWADAIKYCNDIYMGKSTLNIRKNFIASLENAIELFIKQHMLNINDHRIMRVNKKQAKSVPYCDFYAAKDLNDYFVNLPENDVNQFFSEQFSKLIEWQDDLFKDYYNKTGSKSMKNGLEILRGLRNKETHFFITDKDFLCDSDYVILYNLMIKMYDIIKYYNLLHHWGDVLGEEERFAFNRQPLTSFTVEDRLKENTFIKSLKYIIENKEFPAGTGDDTYMMAEDIINYCEEFSDKDFNDVWIYLQMLQRCDLLTVEENAEEDIVDGLVVYGTVTRKYRINLDFD